MNGLRERILERMAKDGRWRTAEDVSNILKADLKSVANVMYNMGLNRELISERAKGYTSYRSAVYKK